MTRKSDILVIVAEKIAASLFIAMLNPQYRGCNFRYKTFDIDRHVKNTIGMSIHWEPSELELTIAGSVAKRAWDRWIEDAGTGIPKEVLE